MKIHIPLLLGVVGIAAPAFAAEPAGDPFLRVPVIPIRDKIPLSVAGKDGKQKQIGDTGYLATLVVARSEGDKVFIRYRGQDAWVAKKDVVLVAEAVAYFSNVVRESPNDASALVRRGNAYLRTGKISEAIADLEAALKLDDKSAAAHNVLGAIYSERNQFDRAMKEYEIASRLAPTWYAPHYNRGILLSKRARHPEAIKAFDEAIALDRGWATVFHIRGLSHGHNKQADKAIEDLSQALRLDPDENGARSVRAVYYATGSIKNFDKAIADLDELIRREPKNVEYLQHRARIRVQTKAYADAKRDYEQAFRLDEINIKPYIGYAELLAAAPDASLRDGKRAVEIALRIVRRNSWWSEIDTLAAAHAEAGDYERAVETQKRAIDALIRAPRPEKGKSPKLEEIIAKQLAEAKSRLVLYESKQPYRLPKE